MTRGDTERRRATPEGVNLSLRVAGPPVRFFAWGVDTVLVFAVQVVLGIFFGLIPGLGTGLYLMCAFLLTWFFPVAFEVWRNGQTPGKSIFGLQVVHDDGTPVGLAASTLRNLMRFADFLPFAFGAGLTSMYLSKDFQRLGDLSAGTLVVYRDAELPGRRVPAAAPVVPPVALDVEERRAVVDFAERVATWTPERAEELAAVAEPLTGARGEAGVLRLLGMANWLLGRSEAPAPAAAEASAAEVGVEVDDVEEVA
ncbi:MAG: RDD family protein [Acidobacteriota bacterium]